MESVNKYKTVIADSQFLITESLKILIGNSHEYTFMGQTDNIHVLENLLNRNDIDLLITDFELIAYADSNTLKNISVKYPRTKILILTNHITKNEFYELNKIGIKNIIYKTVGENEILSAMESTIKDKKYYSGEVLDLLLEYSPSRYESLEVCSLTSSEIEIVRLIAGGHTTKEIAVKKNISSHTVISHRKNIFRKAHVTNVSELIMFAIKEGWIDNIEYYI